MDTSPNDVTKRSITSLYALYLAITAGAVQKDLEVDPTLDGAKVDAVITLAKQTKQDHDLLSSEELDEEVAILFGGESREVLEGRIDTLEGQVTELRDGSYMARRDAETARAQVADLNRKLGVIAGSLTVALRGRPSFDEFMLSGKGDDANAIVDQACQTVKGMDEAMEHQIKSYLKLTEESLKVAASADKLQNENKLIVTTIAAAMGVPPGLAATLSLDVVVEALHSLLCHEHGSMEGPEVDGAGPESIEGDYRVLAVKAAIEKAQETVKGQKPEETMASAFKARASRGPFGLGGLLGLGGPGGIEQVLSGLGRVARGPGGQGPRSGDEEAMMAKLDAVFGKLFGGAGRSGSPEDIERELNDLMGGRGRIRVIGGPRQLGRNGMGAPLSLGLPTRRGPFGDDE